MQYAIHYILVQTLAKSLKRVLLWRGVTNHTADVLSLNSLERLKALQRSYKTTTDWTKGISDARLNLQSLLPKYKALPF